MSAYDIIHYLQIESSAARIFDMITTPKGLDRWWTKHSRGRPELGSIYELGFGADLTWQAQVTQMVHLQEFELTITQCHPDWMNTSVSFELNQEPLKVQLRFYHRGWHQSNEHYHISNFCWAMYLRILKRYIEFEEFVAYEDRLEV